MKNNSQELNDLYGYNERPFFKSLTVLSKNRCDAKLKLILIDSDDWICIVDEEALVNTATKFRGRRTKISHGNRAGVSLILLRLKLYVSVTESSGGYESQQKRNPRLVFYQS